MARKLVLCLVALVPLPVLPAAASATVRYAAPAGATTGTCTDDLPAEPNPPCRLDRAVDDVVVDPGDEIVVQTGTHDLTSTPATVSVVQLNIHGEAGQPRPVILDSDNGIPLTLGGGGSALRFVELRSQAVSAGGALAVSNNQTIEDVVIQATRDCVAADGGPQTYIDVRVTQSSTATETCLNLGLTQQPTLRRVAVTSSATAANNVVDLGPNATIEDSAFTAADGATGLRIRNATVRRVRVSGGDLGIQASGGPIVVTDSIVTTSPTGFFAISHALSAGSGMQLRNVTAIAQGPGSRGVQAGNASGLNSPGRIVARNLIARGEARDLWSLGSGESCGSPCTPGVIDVAFSNFRVFDGSGTRVTGEGNQSGDPRFLGPDDFRLADDSPAIDAGVADQLGPSAFDGAARVQGVAVDMGAYERAGLPGPDAGGSGPGTDPPPGGLPGGPLLPGAADTLAPRLSALSVARRLLTLRLRLTSSEAGVLRVRIVRKLRGRRRAGRCVRGRGRPRCTRRRTLRRLTLPIAAGANALVVRSGRLARGRYELRLVALDAAGNASPVTRLPFRVRR